MLDESYCVEGIVVAEVTKRGVQTEAAEASSLSPTLTLEEQVQHNLTSAEADADRVQNKAERRLLDEIYELKESHIAEIKRIEEYHREQLEHVRTETETKASQALEEKLKQLSLSHSAELQQINSELTSAKQQHVLEEELLKNELIESHSRELEHLTLSHYEELDIQRS